MSKYFISIFPLILSGLLAGCGGGGGGSSASAPASTGSTTTTTPTAPAAPAMVQASLQAAKTPTYAAGSENLGYFTAVNAFRAAQGLGPLNQNVYYDNASAAHAAYTDLNGLSHSETPGLQGFTGANPIARVQYQGGTAAEVSEEAGMPDYQGVGVTGQGASFAGVLINTVYHRATLMYQGNTDIGVSIGVWDGVSPTIPNSVSDLGYNTQQVNAGNYFATYPTNNQGGVSLHMHGESPSPLPAGADPTQYGSPIHVASQESTTLTVTSFTVTQQGSTTALPATLVTSATDSNLTGANNLAFLLAGQAFLPNTTYTVHFVGTITGTATGSSTGIPMDVTWSFTTGTTSN